MLPHGRTSLWSWFCFKRLKTSSSSSSSSAQRSHLLKALLDYHIPQRLKTFIPFYHFVVFVIFHLSWGSHKVRRISPGFPGSSYHLVDATTPKRWFLNDILFKVGVMDGSSGTGYPILKYFQEVLWPPVSLSNPSIQLPRKSRTSSADPPWP